MNLEEAYSHTFTDRDFSLKSCPLCGNKFVRMYYDTKKKHLDDLHHKHWITTCENGHLIKNIETTLYWS